MSSIEVLMSSIEVLMISIGVNHSVARQGCNLLRAVVTSAVTSQGCCCGNLQIHPLDLGQLPLFKEPPFSHLSVHITRFQWHPKTSQRMQLPHPLDYLNFSESLLVFAMQPRSSSLYG